MTNKFISHSLKQRNLDNEEERTVKVSEEVLNQLHGGHYFLKKKGKALYMFLASKELGVVKRKRSLKHLIPSMIKKKKWPKAKERKIYRR